MSISHNLNASIFLYARDEWANLLHLLPRGIVRNLYQNYFFPPEMKVAKMVVIRIYIKDSLYILDRLHFGHFKIIIYVKTFFQLPLISIINTMTSLCFKKKTDFESFNTSFLVTIDLFLLVMHIVILTAASCRVQDILPGFT